LSGAELAMSVTGMSEDDRKNGEEQSRQQFGRPRKAIQKRG
jgi:hypothetical protein